MEQISAQSVPHLANVLPSTVSDWPRLKGSANPPLLALDWSAGVREKLDWPKWPVVYITDLHADANAWWDSLSWAGVIEKKNKRYRLTNTGRKSEIIIGGDCLDKGPTNLALLRDIRSLEKRGARIKLLAGNHDLRLLMGLLAVSRKTNVGNEHLFVRMGKKVVPLFKEVFDTYLVNGRWQQKTPDEATCRAAMFPSDEWFDHFELFAIGHLTQEGINREITKLRSKMANFEHHCHNNGLDLRQVYAATQHCKKLFLNPRGEFYWFFKKMDLIAKRGSFLFLHAGLDDAMAQVLLKRGPRYANRAFRHNLKQDNLFGFYYSPLANTFRTKYRDADLPLSEIGRQAIYQTGVRVIVHGHINRFEGQRLALKRGVLHLECDITLDRASRALEGLSGPGVGVTLINHSNGIVGLSSDYPEIKHLSRKSFEKLCGALS